MGAPILRLIDLRSIVWDDPTVKIATVDSKRRLVLPGAHPGEAYSVWQDQDGHYQLTKVIPAPGKEKPTADQIAALMKSAALTPKMNSEELRKLTREP